MDTTHIPTLIQMADYVIGSNAVSLHCQDKTEAYEYIKRILVTHKYITLKKPAKSILRQYLMAVTGYSKAQTDRLIGQYVSNGNIIPVPRTQPTFAGKYLAEDIIELARIDEAHEDLSGPAIVSILKREYEVFGNKACIRLKDLSSSHLYNLRKTNRYQRRHMSFTKTKSAPVSIGERTKPVNNGQPGYLRVDSVHQGDKDKEKGVYHINLVDEVTQWEVVVCVEGISEKFMIPALTAAMDLFPFMMINFHADNGSEYINQRVAELLERMLGQVKSTINFEDIINSGKILICNFSQGGIGEDTSALFGTTILAMLKVAAERRDNIPEAERRPFYLYVDEFQNFATVPFIKMLSSSRKYKLYLTIAEQSTAQQEERCLTEAILANVSTIVCFRTGSPVDEQLILPRFEPFIEKGEIGNLSSFNFYIRIQAKDSLEPLSGETIVLPKEDSSPEIGRAVIAASQENYATTYKEPPKSNKTDTSKKQSVQSTKKASDKSQVINISGSARKSVKRKNKKKKPKS